MLSLVKAGVLLRPPGMPHCKSIIGRSSLVRCHGDTFFRAGLREALLMAWMPPPDGELCR